MSRITECGYGFFPGGDPRDFSPDGDATPEELENHRLACEAWDRGGQQSEPDCQHSPGLIVTRCQFGLGTYTYVEDISWGEWVRYIAVPRVRMWLYWRVPRRVQDWMDERERRAILKDYEQAKEGR